jgi:hypothetical protein
VVGKEDWKVGGALDAAEEAPYSIFHFSHGAGFEPR